MELHGKSGTHVLIIVENLPVPFDRRVWMEATTLNDHGYQVSVVCPTDLRHPREFEQIDGISIFRHPLPPEVSSSFGYIREYLAALSWEWRLSRRIWKKKPFHIIHLCNPPDLLFVIALWFKVVHRVKVVFDQHDLNPEMYMAKFGKRGIFYYLLLLAEWLSYRVADVVISTNESYREIATGRGRKRDQDVFVVRSGPDLSRFLSKQPASPGIEKNGIKYVGYVGVMGEQEGIDYLLRAAAYLVNERERKDVHFVLIGDGPARVALMELTAKLGLGKNVEFLGRVADEELINRLSECVVCVNPDPKTPFNDLSTMNKILEYMALEKPIVQFDLCEGRRSAGEASLYATPNDERDFGEKILNLVDDSALRNSMAKIGRKRMEDELHWGHQATELIAAYGKVRP